MSVKSSIQNRGWVNNEYSVCRNVAKSAFVKLNGRKGTKGKGLGHSSTNFNNFDRRNSTTTIQSAESSNNYVPIRPLSVQDYRPLSRLQNNNLQFTEQRNNYETMSQQYQSASHSESSLRSVIHASRMPTPCTEHSLSPFSFAETGEIDPKFHALRKFRLENSKECYGGGQLQTHTQESRTNNAEILDHKPSKPGILKQHLSTKSIPYALRQSLLRTELAKDISNRLTQMEYLNKGLNKSFALSYQSMYNHRRR